MTCRQGKSLHMLGFIDLAVPSLCLFGSVFWLSLGVP
jgi:hypothetical protein